MIQSGNYRYYLLSYMNRVVRCPNIVLDYAEFLVKSGNFWLETRLGPKYKFNVESYKLFVPLSKSVVTGNIFYVLAHLFL
jgi:hypothetical protein